MRAHLRVSEHEDQVRGAFCGKERAQILAPWWEMGSLQADLMDLVSLDTHRPAMLTWEQGYGSTDPPGASLRIPAEKSPRKVTLPGQSNRL